MRADRFILGSLSGMLGGIVSLLIWSLPAKMLGLTDRIFYDYGMHLILFEPKKGFLDYLVGLLAHLGVSAVHGAILAGLIYLTSSRYLYLKGFLYGYFVWLIHLSIGTLFRIPLFTVIPANAALVTWISSGLWGLATSICLDILNSYAEKANYGHGRSILPVPAMKKEKRE